jgi:hypothetical protein
MLVDIQTISIATASASVVIGVVYYILQIRHQTKTRQTDLVMKLYSQFNSIEFARATYFPAGSDTSRELNVSVF